MHIELIAFDLDGTTLNSSKELSAGNRQALKKAHAAGVKLVPCTGRSLNELPGGLTNLIDELGFDAFSCIITDNGAQAYDLPKRKLLFTKNIPEVTALAIVAEGRKHLALTYGSFGMEGATDNRGKVWETPEAGDFIKQYARDWGLPAGNLEELIKWNCGVVKMSMNFMDAGEYQSCLEFFSSWPGIDLSSADEKNIEFMIAGINKGETLNFVSEYTGVPWERIMAIGDNRNDMEMIVRSAFGVAMGNAISELKERADWVTAVNDEDGLALAIEKALAK